MMQANKISYYPIAHFIRNKLLRCYPKVVLPPALRLLISTADTIDLFTNELWLRNGMNQNNINVLLSTSDIKPYFGITKTNESKQYANMTVEEIESVILGLLDNIKERQILDMIKYCFEYRKLISESTLNKLFRSYSMAGKPDIVIVLQKYCAVVNFDLYTRNGEFQHYLAKAHCYKGNAEKGLSILSNCYTKFNQLRGFYRVIFKELIHDSVLNRSEATLVIFKKYVFEFSSKWKDDYPLVCYWHMLWSSSWYSDQMLANELFDTSENLQNIVKERAADLSINILRDYNDDAVMRLLQLLLKYKMMTEYASVLQVLFNYKLRNRDLRGCMEIVRNCDTLGISLPADQRGRYIRMLINNEVPNEKSPAAKITSKNFKLKF